MTEHCNCDGDDPNAFSAPVEFTTDAPIECICKITMERFKNYPNIKQFPRSQTKSMKSTFGHDVWILEHYQLGNPNSDSWLTNKTVAAFEVNPNRRYMTGKDLPIVIVKRDGVYTLEVVDKYAKKYSNIKIVGENAINRLPSASKKLGKFRERYTMTVKNCVDEAFGLYWKSYQGKRIDKWVYYIHKKPDDFSCYE